MKKITLIHLLYFLSFYSQAFQKDKALHTTFSFIISTAATSVSEQRMVGYCVCLSAGHLKESMDARDSYNYYSAKDMWFNALGCFLGTEFSLELSSRYRIALTTRSNDVALNFSYTW